MKLSALTSFHKVQDGVLANAVVRTRDDGSLPVQSSLAIVLGAANHFTHSQYSTRSAYANPLLNDS